MESCYLSGRGQTYLFMKSIKGFEFCVLAILAIEDEPTKRARLGFASKTWNIYHTTFHGASAVAE